MKLFISWSKPVSQQIAQELRQWIPLILPAVKPFVTFSDIEKGAKWLSDITTRLEETDFGLLCLTRENLESQWLAFEAGALSKKLGSRVATVLFGVAQAEVNQPLAMFQGTLFNNSDFRQLVSSINASAPVDAKRGEDELDTLFPMLWPKIEQPVELILKNAATKAPQDVRQPNLPAMVTELLTLTRSQTSLWSNPERVLAPIVQNIERLLVEVRIQSEQRDRSRRFRPIRSQLETQLETQQGIEAVFALARKMADANANSDDILTTVADRMREYGECQVRWSERGLEIETPGGTWLSPITRKDSK